MSERERYEYEDGAELRTESLWCCRTCGKAWSPEKIGASAEHYARACCLKTMPCSQEGCTGRTEYAFQVCRGCRSRFDAERHAKRERAPWDGETPLYDDHRDEFLMDIDAVLDAIEEHPDGEPQLLICEPSTLRRLNLSEWISDEISDDEDASDAIDDEGRALEAALNDYLDRLEARPLSWSRGKLVPDPATLPKPAPRDERENA